jgi:hypothetical protein
MSYPNILERSSSNESQNILSDDNPKGKKDYKTFSEDKYVLTKVELNFIIVPIFLVAVSITCAILSVTIEIIADRLVACMLHINVLNQI